jgi:hypothetical protein
MATSTPPEVQSEEIERVFDPIAAIGDNRNCSDDYDRTDLHKAVLAGDVSRVKSILETQRTRPVEEAQDVVNARDCFGLTPLHLAVRGFPPRSKPLAKSGYEEAKEKYHEVGEGREDSQDPSGFTSSRFQAVHRFLTKRKSLAKEGLSNEEAKGYREGQEDRKEAGDSHKNAREDNEQADKVREEVVRLLVASSWLLPDKFITATSEDDERGQRCGRCTPLHLAARAGSIPILKLLLQPPICRGDYKSCDPINVRATAWNGYTVLDVAHKYGHEHVVELLKNYDTSWLEDERTKLTSFLNAIMVGATLILAAAFGAWRLPPMGVQQISDGATEDARKIFVSQSKAAYHCYGYIHLVFGFAIMALLTCISAMRRRELTLRLDVENLRRKASHASELLLVALFMFANVYWIVSMLVWSTIANDALNTNAWIITTSGSLFP